jgi:hypothetical protein
MPCERPVRLLVTLIICAILKSGFLITQIIYDGLKHQRFKKHYITIDRFFCTGYSTQYKQLIAVLIMKIKALLLTALVASQAFTYASAASKFPTIEATIAHKEVRDTKKGSSSPYISECGGTCGGK